VMAIVFVKIPVSHNIGSMNLSFVRGGLRGFIRVPAMGELTMKFTQDLGTHALGEVAHYIAAIFGAHR
jgi:hypothetical protein